LLKLLSFAHIFRIFSSYHRSRVIQIPRKAHNLLSKGKLRYVRGFLRFFSALTLANIRPLRYPHFSYFVVISFSLLSLTCIPGVIIQFNLIAEGFRNKNRLLVIFWRGRDQLTDDSNARALGRIIYRYDVIFRELFVFCFKIYTLFSEFGSLAICLTEVPRTL